MGVGAVHRDEYLGSQYTFFHYTADTLFHHLSHDFLLINQIMSLPHKDSDSDDDFYKYEMPGHLKGPDEIQHPHSELGTVPSYIHPPESKRPDRVPTESSTAPKTSISSQTKSKWRWACDDKGERKWCSAIPPNANEPTTILVFQKHDNGSLELIPCFPDRTGRNPTCHDPKKRSDLFAELTKTITALSPSACLKFTSKVKQGGTIEAQTSWPYRALQSLTNRFELTDIRFRRVCQEIGIDDIGKGEHYSDIGSITHQSTNHSLLKLAGDRLLKHVNTENAKTTTGVGTEAPA
jgi:hypothetical protein